ncbi:hypothetical protein [Pseudomonas sp. SM4]|jgi:hypothetical protein|uniref:hypothetical protein n=1 Tax=Pseudomonas sp. SM4 TaxID=3424177 RepID=UPI003F799E51
MSTHNDGYQRIDADTYNNCAREAQTHGGLPTLSAARELQKQFAGQWNVTSGYIWTTEKASGVPDESPAPGHESGTSYVVIDMQTGVEKKFDGNMRVQSYYKSGS